MISNYGLFWQRKYVHFEPGGKKRSLLGKNSQKHSVLVDFGEQIGIYVLYDKDCIPIYVGQAGNGNGTLFTQLQQHTMDSLSNRWDYFTWFGLRRVKANRRLAAYSSIEKTIKAQDGSRLDESKENLFAKRGPKQYTLGSKIKEGAEEYLQAVEIIR